MSFLSGVNLLGAKLLNGAKPVPARMCTWEMVTTFDGHPSEEQLLKQFHLDFPQIDVSKILVTLMTSQNSPEGRKLRYLVMMPECEVGEKYRGFTRIFSSCFSKRLVPRQAWLFGWADQHFPDVNGNCLFWKIVDGVLYILVFFEGRLCHWSEEVGYGLEEGVAQKVLVENRLERFRKFLNTDALFSRVEKFAEVGMDEDRLDVRGGVCERRLFKKAVKDSFWKNIDLRKVGKEFVLAEGLPHKMGLYGGLLLAVVSLVLVGFGMDVVLKIMMNFGTDYVNEKMVDAIPVELDVPELVEILEERNVSFREEVPKPRKEISYEESRPTCILPEVHLKGIVGEKLFVAIVDIAEPAKTFFVGDSLGNFMVQEIERTQVQLVCGDSSAVISMR